MVWPFVVVVVVAAQPSVVGGADVGQPQLVAGVGDVVAAADGATDDVDTYSSWAVLGLLLIPVIHWDGIRMDCRRIDDGDDGGYKSCNAIFHCYSNPCCCSARTVRQSTEDTMDNQKECLDGDDVDIQS